MIGALFGFRGRMGRLAYLLASLGVFAVVALTVPLLLLASISAGGYGRGGLEGPGLLIVPIALTGAWMQVSLAVRRLHDIDWSGWHAVWLALVPLPAQLLPTLLDMAVSILPWLWLCAARGTEGPNRYGRGGGLAG